MMFMFVLYRLFVGFRALVVISIPLIPILVLGIYLHSTAVLVIAAISFLLLVCFILGDNITLA